MEQTAGKGHNTVSGTAEITERQQETEVSQQTIQQRIQDREKVVTVLQQEVKAINLSADKAVEDSERIFNELIELLERSRYDVNQRIRSQQETERRRVKELQAKLEQEIAELKRRDAELKHMPHTEDHSQFLQNYFGGVTAAVSETRDQLQEILREKWTNISWTVTQVDVLLPQPEPKTRAEFLKYSREITLDPNTANKWLLLSEGNRKVTVMKEEQSYSRHADRFIDDCQVLSRKSLAGRYYWEVELTGGGVDVAVAYKNNSRAGGESAFGWNDKSWALHCDQQSYTFWENKSPTFVSCPPSNRVGVYLDHRAGILSFYSVSETMTLLHRVQTTFTDPLYAGLGLYCPPGDTAEFILL